LKTLVVGIRTAGSAGVEVRDWIELRPAVVRRVHPVVFLVVDLVEPLRQVVVQDVGRDADFSEVRLIDLDECLNLRSDGHWEQVHAASRVFANR
jgi:hypothetical protein